MVFDLLEKLVVTSSGLILTVLKLQLLAFLFVIVLWHWDFSHGKFNLLSQGESQMRQSHYPIYGACWMFECFHNPPHSDMDYRIFNIYAHKCWCMQLHSGVHTHLKRVYTESWLWKLDSGRKIPCHTGESNLHQWDASLMLYQLSYIPSSLPLLSGGQFCPAWSDNVAIYLSIFKTNTHSF